MKKQRHVWVLTDNDGTVRKNFFDLTSPYAFLTRSAARKTKLHKNSQNDYVLSIVKYVPENKALIEAAKKLIYIVAKDRWVDPKITDAAEELQKALEAE